MVARRRKAGGLASLMRFLMAFLNPARRRQGWKQLVAESRRRKCERIHLRRKGYLSR
jgi:hypothetical protein